MAIEPGGSDRSPHPATRRPPSPGRGPRRPRGLLRRLGLAAALLLPALVAVVGLVPGPVDAVQTSAGELLRADTEPARVIVQYRGNSALMSVVSADAQLRMTAQGVPRVLPLHAAAMGRRLGLSLTDGHVLGARMQSLRASGISAQALAAQLAAQPDVEWAQVVGRKHAAAVTPNDPLYPGSQTSTTPVVGQWYLRGAGHKAVSALNGEGAWSVSTGSAAVTVAVVDTGVRFDHPDLSGKLWPGYDFVSRTSNSGDSTGTDNDASDPGDFCSSTGESSSWHGTLVAGLIGAATDNGIGMASIGRNVMVLPVRGLGRCGGYDDDILAAIRWAAGLDNDAACTSSATRSSSCNPHPAQVINLSLGSSGSCDSAYQTVFDTLTAAGVSVVAAGGNNEGLAVITPGNCSGVIAVGAARHIGTKVGFSAVGPELTVSAPGGNCVNTASGSACLYPLVTTTNSGTSTPGSNTYTTSYSYEVGTSFSAPLVAGTVGLMRSANAGLSPAQVISILKATARPFPTLGAQTTTATTCHAPNGSVQDECYCTTSTCGAGLLDAGAAVARAAGVNLAPQAVISVAGTPVVGTPLALQATASSVGVSAWQWALTSGSGIARLTGGNTGSGTTLVFDAPGSATVALTVTDANGLSSTGSATLSSGPSVRISATSSSMTVGDSQTLSAVASAGDGRSIVSYSWSVTAGTAAASISGASTAASATLRALAAGSATVELTVTDSAGISSSASQDISVVAASSGGGSSSGGSTSGSSSSGGGGGAGGPGALLGLAAALWALRRRP